MTPLAFYVLVFSPIVVVALGVVPILLAYRDANTGDRPNAAATGHLSSAWSASAPAAVHGHDHGRL